MKKLFVCLAILLIAVFASGFIFITGKPPANTGPAISDDFSSDTSSNYTDIITDKGMAYDSTNHRAIAEGGIWSGVNMAYYSGTGANLGSANHYVQALVYSSGSGTTGSTGVILRCNGNGTSSTGYYVEPVHIYPTHIDLSTFSGSSSTFAARWTTTETWGDGDAHLIKVTVSGSTFHLYVDWNDDGDFEDTGEDEGTKTDTTYSTGNYVGLYFYNNGAAPYIDDFEAGTL